MSTAGQRREELKARLRAGLRLRSAARSSRGRGRSVVFGAGNADAELMFVGEAPGANEDAQGVPFVGADGRAARSGCSAEIGLARATSSSATS